MFSRCIFVDGLKDGKCRSEGEKNLPSRYAIYRGLRGVFAQYFYFFRGLDNGLAFMGLRPYFAMAVIV